MKESANEKSSRLGASLGCADSSARDTAEVQSGPSSPAGQGESGEVGLADGLPAGWAEVNFDELFDFKGGSQPPKKEFKDEPGEGLVRLLQIRDFASDAFPVYIKDADKWPKCAESDVMIARYGASLGRILTGMAGAYNVALVRMIFDKENLSTDWVRYFLKSDHFQEPIHLLSRSAQNGFNKKELASIRVEVPPKAEQIRIVSAIESLQERSARAKQALCEVGPLLSQLRQSVLRGAFSGRLTERWRTENPNVEPASELLARIRTERRERWETAQLAKYEAKGKQPPKNWQDKYDKKTKKATRASVADVRAEGVELDEIPEGWELVRLGEIVDLQAGYAFKSKWFVDDGIRLLRGTNIEPGAMRWTDTEHLSIDQSAEYDEYQLAEGDVVIAMDRPVISSGLKIARISKVDLPALLLQRVGRFKVEDEITSDFVYLYLQSPFFLLHIGAQATGALVPHISANDIESAIVPLPPLDEQNEIVRFTVEALAMADHAEESAASSEAELMQLDQSILAKAFRGELVPQDPSDEPASQLLHRIRTTREKLEAEKKAKKTSNKKKARKSK